MSSEVWMLPVFKLCHLKVEVEILLFFQKLKEPPTDRQMENCSVNLFLLFLDNYFHTKKRKSEMETEGCEESERE